MEKKIQQLINHIGSDFAKSFTSFLICVSELHFLRLSGALFQRRIESPMPELNVRLDLPTYINLPEVIALVEVDTLLIV